MILAGNIVLLLFGLSLLYFGAEWLVRGSASLASHLGVSPIVIGLTVVSLGTSAPELAVCVLAALQGHSDIVMGNVLGSNLANVGLILGVTALVRPLEVAARVVTREVPLMILITAGLYAFILDYELTRSDGVGLLIILVLVLTVIFSTAEGEKPEIVVEYESFVDAVTPGETAKARLKDAVLIVSGSGCLVFAGWVIVDSAEYVATALGLPHILISLSVIAIGTSLPELATSLVAALRSEADIAVGNVIGSNIFNIAAVLGITSVVSPVDVTPAVLTTHLPAVLILSVLIWPVTWAGFKIRRWEGLTLLVVYLLIMGWLFGEGLL